MREARKHAAWYMKGMRGAAAFRKAGRGAHRFDDARRLADDVLAANSDIFRVLYNL